MIDCDRTFVVASDVSLVELIRAAKRRLVVVCPAVSDAVGGALTDRLTDLGPLAITVILDADPEVYRLGYGTTSALEKLRYASSQNLLDLRMQAGVRIGVVISDSTTMLFAPVPMLIEAGSTTIEKPNAIILSGVTTENIAEAAGAGATSSSRKQEIGTEALRPALVEALEKDLKINPPQAFDVARTLRVFSSQVQYVELEVANYRLSSRQVQLPPELLDITDSELRERISSRIRTPIQGLGKIKMDIETPTGVKQDEIDEQWLTSKRKRIEDDYTFVIPRFGRVIVSALRCDFDKEIVLYKRVVEDYQKAVIGSLEHIKSGFIQKLVDEYLPRWAENPPKTLTRYAPAPDLLDIELYLRNIAKRLFADAVNFAPPHVRVIYKNIAPESVRDPAFLKPLQIAMERRGVPEKTIAYLFASGDAAPTLGGLTTH